MKNILDLLSRLGLLCRLETAIVKELESLSARVYALEENRKLKDSAILQLEKDVATLRAELRGKVKADVQA